MDREQIKARLMNIAGFTVNDVVQIVDGKIEVADFRALSHQQFDAIREIDVETHLDGSIHRVRLMTHDAVKAAEILLDMEQANEA